MWGLNHQQEGIWLRRDPHILQLALRRINSLLLRNGCCWKGFAGCLLLLTLIVISILSSSTFLSGIGFCRIPNAKNYVYLGFTGSPQKTLAYRQERDQDTSGSLPTLECGISIRSLMWPGSHCPLSSKAIWSRPFSSPGSCLLLHYPWAA